MSGECEICGNHTLECICDIFPKEEREASYRSFLE
jgi:hypothetical protein